MVTVQLGVECFLKEFTEYFWEYKGKWRRRSQGFFSYRQSDWKSNQISDSDHHHHGQGYRAKQFLITSSCVRSRITTARQQSSGSSHQQQIVEKKKLLGWWWWWWWWWDIYPKVRLWLYLSCELVTREYRERSRCWCEDDVRWFASFGFLCTHSQNKLPFFYLKCKYWSVGGVCKNNFYWKKL